MEPLNNGIGIDERNDSEALKTDQVNNITFCKKSLEGTDNKYYNDGAMYWSSVDPSVDGMLGGFGNISNIDIEGSAKFLKGIFKLEKAPGKERALDCGAGIGRITKYLLKRHFKCVDLVEQNEIFLEKAVEYLGKEERPEDKSKFFCCGLQNFLPENQNYDVIWCQWVLGQLTDTHLIDFFKRCTSGLKPNGVIIVKENITSSGKVEMDDIDSSVTRTDSRFHYVFQTANLEIIRELPQKKFPQELYNVKMYALKPKQEK